MFNNRYIGISEIIEDAHTRTGDQKIDWNIVLFAVKQFFGKIGIANYYEDKEKGVLTDSFLIPPLCVENYRTNLPDDLVYITGVREYYSNSPIILNNENFSYDLDYSVSSNSSSYSSSITEEDYKKYTCITEDQIQDPDLRSQYFTFLNRYQNGVYNSLDNRNTSIYVNNNLLYKHVGNMLQFNFKEGLVRLAYKAYPVDSEGFPLIPDDEKFKEAIVASIIEVIDYRRFRAKEISAQEYSFSKREKSSLMQAVTSYAKTPSLEDMKVIAPMFSRFIPRKNLQFYDFKGIGNMEKFHPNKNTSNI